MGDKKSLIIIGLTILLIIFVSFYFAGKYLDSQRKEQSTNQIGSEIIKASKIYNVSDIFELSIHGRIQVANVQITDMKVSQDRMVKVDIKCLDDQCVESFGATLTDIDGHVISKLEDNSSEIIKFGNGGMVYDFIQLKNQDKNDYYLVFGSGLGVKLSPYVYQSF